MKLLKLEFGCYWIRMKLLRCCASEEWNWFDITQLLRLYESSIYCFPSVTKSRIKRERRTVKLDFLCRARLTVLAFAQHTV